MFGLHSLKANPQKMLGLLEDFEEYCLGKRSMSQQEFRNINEELSLGAILHIGRCRFKNHEDGKHLVWTAPDRNEYDLGPVEKLNVMRDCPGFNRQLSLSLAHDQVEENNFMEIDHLKRQISVVKLKDGTTGIGPNYRIALRNAALRMHLKNAFNRANPLNLWKMFYGNA